MGNNARKNQTNRLEKIIRYMTDPRNTMLRANNMKQPIRKLIAVTRPPYILPAQMPIITTKNEKAKIPTMPEDRKTEFVSITE
jgi:hypothetical protein